MSEANKLVVRRDLHRFLSIDRLNKLTAMPECMKDVQDLPGEEVIDIADADEELEQMKKSVRETSERLKDGKKSAYIAPELNKIALDPAVNSKGTRERIDLNDAKNGITCDACRTDPKARSRNETNPSWCVFCCANLQARQAYGTTYNVNRRRAEQQELAARVRLFMDSLELYSPQGRRQLSNTDLKEILSTMTESMLGNMMHDDGERILKALSHIGEVRVDPSLAPKICGLSRLKQLSVLIECIFDPSDRCDHYYFRLGKDMGNVLYKDFFWRVVGNDSSRMVVQQLEGSSAERVGDVVEMWLGFLDLCDQAGDSGLIRPTFSAGDMYHGLEQALLVYASVSRHVTTLNNKRNKTPDSWVTEEERHAVQRYLGDARKANSSI